MTWPDVDEGKVFSFILQNKTVETEYIGRYKDEKAYSFYESGFVRCLYSYCLPDQRNKVFIKGDVTPSTKVRDRRHNTWILFDNNSILTTWCTCVAGTSLCCNHILAVLYKINFAQMLNYLTMKHEQHENERKKDDHGRKKTSIRRKKDEDGRNEVAVVDVSTSKR